MILYLVVPCFNEEAGIEKSCHILKEYCQGLIQKGLIRNQSKIVLVNDGSTDSTGEILEKIHEADPAFSVINFSRNYGHQYAVLAGYEFAAGKCDACISIDADLQQDIRAIEEFVKKYKEGYDVVYGVRNTRDTDGFFKRMTSQVFYKMMLTFGCNIIPNHADYRLISSKVLFALQNYKESTVFLRGLFPAMGFRSTKVFFDVSPRTEGESKYTLKKMMKLAGDGIISFSTFPVYLVFSLGLVMTGLGLLGVIFSLILSGFGSSTALIFFLILLTGIVVTTNGVLGQYVVNACIEVKNRPRYLIDNIYHTDCTADTVCNGKED